MTLPKGFLFSQSNLQDYVDCQRRFQLRYLERLAWPAVEAEPIRDYERQVHQGLQFHKLVRQHLLGVPEMQIESSLGSDELMLLWWRNYVHSTQSGSLAFIRQAGNQPFEEISLSARVGDFRLTAKYDLIILTADQRFVILDWKTSQRRPKKSWLAERLQTRVYPFVLMQAAQSISRGKPAAPAHIEMTYWFTNFPEQPERFAYSSFAYRSDTQFLEELLATISQKSEKTYPLTPDMRRCLYCTYRSLCNRGIKPGEALQLEEWQSAEPSAEDVTIDYEQIGEIEY